MVTFQFASPETHYAWQHVSQFYPTAHSARAGMPTVLETEVDGSIGGISFSGKDGIVRTVSEHFEAMPLDAVLVMKDGKIVYERYKTMTPDTAHITFSSSKVFSSTILALLEEEGKVDLSKPVTDYVEELKGSVWDTVTVRETADMQTGLNGTEHDEPNPDSRTNPQQVWYRWAATLSIFPNQGEDDTFAVLRAMERNKPGGEVFEYNSINTWLLARIAEAIEDRPFAEIFTDRIWNKIGANHDGTFIMSPNGYALAFGMTSITLRDFARFGAMFTPSAETVTGSKVISDEILDRIQTSGNPDAYPDGYVGEVMSPKFADAAGEISNAYMRDAILPDGGLFKGGVGGQGLYVSPSRDLIAVRFPTGDGSEWNEAMARAIALHYR
ncbi:MAG: beta-lactamase family protein [Leucobacter sp.]|nr:beta-lactamase family protein [Leucobacter sp.]